MSVLPFNHICEIWWSVLLSTVAGRRGGIYMHNRMPVQHSRRWLFLSVEQKNQDILKSQPLPSVIPWGKVGSHILSLDMRRKCGSAEDLHSCFPQNVTWRYGGHVMNGDQTLSTSHLVPGWLREHKFDKQLCCRSIILFVWETMKFSTTVHIYHFSSQYHLRALPRTCIVYVKVILACLIVKLIPSNGSNKNSLMIILKMEFGCT